MVTIKATIKEVGNDNILTPEYLVPDEEAKFLSDSFFIDFWGLDRDDVEWYALEREGKKTSCFSWRKDIKRKSTELIP